MLRIKPNLTSGENAALKELIENQNIVIKPADKCSMVVVMSREQYPWEGQRQLGDKLYYAKWNKPIYMETQKQITKIFGNISEKKMINAK